MTSKEAKNPQDNWTFGDWMESRVVILNDNKELEADLAAARAEAARLRARWEQAVEYARMLPPDGPVTGWTVLDALVRLEKT